MPALISWMLAKDMTPGSETKEFVTKVNIITQVINIFLHQFPKPQFPWHDIENQITQRDSGELHYKRGTLGIEYPNLLKWAVNMPTLCSRGKLCFYIPRLQANVLLALEGDKIFIFQGCRVCKHP